MMKSFQIDSVYQAILIYNEYIKKYKSGYIVPHYARHFWKKRIFKR